MGNFAMASMAYLDDEPKYIKHAFDFFKKHGYHLQTFDSIEEAKRQVLSGGMEIFICDLVLDQMKSNESLMTGYQILVDIRDENKNIFLALYTAYDRQLSDEQIAVCKARDIMIYTKDEDEEFMMNIQNDYNSFSKEKYDSISEKDFFIISKDLVLKHLKKVSNQDAKIYWSTAKYFQIKDLIKEIENETEIGKEYMKGWLKTVAILQEIRNKN